MDTETLDRILHGSAELKELCFGFFMAFSRFEFALKENGFYRPGRYGEANPDWKKFRDEFADRFSPGEPEQTLRTAPPRQQAVSNGAVTWREVDLDREPTELGKVILMVKTIRNNLFHGGKHGLEDWDNPKRTAFLLSTGIRVLDRLAVLGGFESDYVRLY